MMSTITTNPTVETRPRPQPTFRIERADTPALRDRVYALRYRAYRRVDAIDKSGDRRFSDHYDEQPNSMTYLLSENDVLLGAIRASLYCPVDDRPAVGNGRAELTGRDIPCCETYRDAIAEAIGVDKRIVESSRFVTADVSFDVMMNTQFQLFRMICANARVHAADWVVTAVRRKHVLIYRKLFGMRRLSEPRRYYGLKDEMILVGVPFTVYEDVCEREPRLFVSRLEAEQYAM